MMKQNKQRTNRTLKKLIALCVCLVMLFQLVGVLPVISTHAEVERQGEQMITFDNPAQGSYIYAGETITLKVAAYNAKNLTWEWSDTDHDYCVFETSGDKNSGNICTVKAIAGGEEGPGIVTVTVTDSDTHNSETVTFYVMNNDQFYFVCNDKKVDDSKISVQLGGDVTISTNQSQSISFTNTSDFVTVTPNTTNTKYVVKGLLVNGTTSPIHLSSTYTFSDDYGMHTITLTKELYVVETLSLSDHALTMKKGGEDGPSTATLVATNINENSTNKVVWKVFQGQLTSGEVASLDAVEMDKKLISITPSGAVNETALISISKDLHLTTSESDVFTIVATQTIGDRVLTDICYVTVTQPVTALTMQQHDTTLYLDGSDSEVIANLTATLAGDTTTIPNIDPSNKEILWSSTDSSVVSFVESNGGFSASHTGKGFATIAALKPGHCVVVASAIDNPSASDVIYIEVLPKVSSVEIVNPSMTVNWADQYVQLFANVTSEVVDSKKDTDEYETYLSALNQTVIWSSSNTNVATVDQYTGKVNLKAAGQTTITCSSADDAKIKDSIIITVNVPVASITLQDYNKRIGVGESFTLNYTLNSNYPGYEPSNKDVVWESSDTKVATVDNDGKVTGISGGTATILIRADDGQITATCTVQVYQAVSRIDISDTKLEMNVGDEAVLEATVYPTTASQQVVTWSSNKPEYVSITPDGVVTAKKVGEPVVITASIENDQNTVTATCVVTVVVPITSITLTPDEVTLRKGETSIIEKAITPANATQNTLVYASTDTGVATVTPEGKITAVSGGTCYITARSLSRDMISSVFVTVTEEVRKITLDTTTKVMKKGKSFVLIPTVYNSSATNKELSFKSSNTSVATVSSTTGKVTAKGYGTCVITCNAMDGSGVKATCKVTVRRYVTKISFGTKKLVMKTKTKRTLKPRIAPTNADVKKVTWKSSNKKIATVDKKGKVTAKNPGTCTITCTAADGSKVKGKIKIKVKQTLADNEITGTKK